MREIIFLLKKFDLQMTLNYGKKHIFWLFFMRVGRENQNSGICGVFASEDFVFPQRKVMHFFPVTVIICRHYVISAAEYIFQKSSNTDEIIELNSGHSLIKLPFHLWLLKTLHIRRYLHGC